MYIPHTNLFVIAVKVYRNHFWGETGMIRDTGNSRRITPSTFILTGEDVQSSFLKFNKKLTSQIFLLPYLSDISRKKD